MAQTSRPSCWVWTAARSLPCLQPSAVPAEGAFGIRVTEQPERAEVSRTTRGILTGTLVEIVWEASKLQELVGAVNVGPSVRASSAETYQQFAW